MQNTENIEAKLAAYVDGELDEAGRAEIEQHLLANPQHRALLEELIAHSGFVRELPRESAPPEVTEMLSQQLERAALLGDVDIGVNDGSMRISRWPQFRAIAAVLVLTVGLGALVYFVLPSPNESASRVAILPPDESVGAGLDAAPGAVAARADESAAPAPSRTPGAPSAGTAGPGHTASELAAAGLRSTAAPAERQPAAPTAVTDTPAAASPVVGNEVLAAAASARREAVGPGLAPEPSEGEAIETAGAFESAAVAAPHAQAVVVVRASDLDRAAAQLIAFLGENRIDWEPLPAAHEPSDLAHRATQADASEPSTAPSSEPTASGIGLAESSVSNAPDTGVGAVLKESAATLPSIASSDPSKPRSDEGVTTGPAVDGSAPNQEDATARAAFADAQSGRKQSERSARQAAQASAHNVRTAMYLARNVTRRQAGALSNELSQNALRQQANVYDRAAVDRSRAGGYAQLPAPTAGPMARAYGVAEDRLAANRAAEPAPGAAGAGSADAQTTQAKDTTSQAAAGRLDDKATAPDAKPPFGPAESDPARQFLSAGDIVRVVAREPKSATAAPVSELRVIDRDGNVTIDGVGSVRAAGLTGEELARQIAQLLPEDQRGRLGALTWTIEKLPPSPEQQSAAREKFGPSQAPAWSGGADRGQAAKTEADTMRRPGHEGRGSGEPIDGSSTRPADPTGQDAMAQKSDSDERLDVVIVVYASSTDRAEPPIMSDLPGSGDPTLGRSLNPVAATQPTTRPSVPATTATTAPAAPFPDARESR